MKRLAISIRQPWVEQILRGKKRVEYRSSNTKIRGVVYLYASMKPVEDEPAEGLPTGMIVGTVEVYDSVKSKRWRDTWEWKLRNPQRLKRPFRPTKQPQPVWFYPR